MVTLEQKIALYRDFWDNKPVTKPLIGFDLGGWFPFQRFSDLKVIEDKSFFGPEAIDPARCLPDYEILAQKAFEVPDDFIKGLSPISAIPWLEGMLGCRLMRNGESVWAEERKAGWSLLKNLSLPNDNKWFKKYIDFVKALSKLAAGRYPVGVPILRGPADLLGALRGHTESILDCMENPEDARRLGRFCADALIRITKAHHKATDPFEGGYFIEQYSLWAPGPLVRMQEDASALYSPDLYRSIIMECDRMIARAFPYSLIHLHSSSLFLIKEFIEIREIGVFQINKDVGEMGLPEMIPFLKIVQDAGRRIFLRGPLSADDLGIIKKELSPRGLMVQSVTGSIDEARYLSREAARIFG
jgi:hypothetical protein